LLFQAQGNAGVKHKAEFIGAMASEENISHWIRYGCEEYGELQPYKSFGMFRWIEMKIG
jgi:hypothetical protein